LSINLDPPVVVEDRQLVVLAAHVATTMRTLTNAQQRGQVTVVKAEAARNNQPKSGSKDVQNITLNVIF
jgi:hypothetical protein